MWGRKETEQLIAAAVYGELNADERRTLEARLKRDPALHAEYEALRAMATAIPNAQPECPVELMPRLRAHLNTDAREAARVTLWRPALFAAACLAAVAMLGYSARLSLNGAGEAAPIAGAAPVARSPVQLALDQADPWVREGEAARAYQRVADAVAATPEDPYAAQGQLFLAELAFENLNWFDEARKAYEHYASSYRTAYLTSPASSEITWRRNLLEEARADQYRALDAIVAADALGADGFARLEDVIAEHPAGYVAELAGDHMVLALGAETGIQGLEQALARAGNPVAVAHLQVELADRYQTERGDTARSRSLYEDVIEGPNEAYARLASERVARLDTP